jgi:Tfp pilus assembly protein PilX
LNATFARRERGATLLVTLVMLIIITLFAVSAFNTASVNIKTVGNMQARQEALAAATRTIEETISHTDFTITPTNAIPNPCSVGPNTLCTDLNGDGTPELTTTLTPTPTCSQGRVLKIAELVGGTTITQSNLACLVGQQQGTFAVAGATPNGDSLCAQSVWDVRAQTLTYGATAATSDVNVAVTQGVGIRMGALDLAANCP